MKAIFQGNETANVSAIQSASVNPKAKRIEIFVKYEREETEEKVLPIVARYFEKEVAKKIADELEDLSKDPDRPIEKIVELKAWECGHLQVKLDIKNDASVQGLARLCWNWWTLKGSPTDEQLEFRTGLSPDEIQKVAKTNIYREIVKALMFKHRTADEFKKWVKNYGKNMPAGLGKRMRLSKDTVTELINSVAEKHGIDLNDLDRRDSSTRRRKNMIREKTIGYGKESVYLYYYPQYRKSAESKGEEVWECKIGKTVDSEANKRIKSQTTGLPENPKIGLHIKTDKAREIEQIIHKILKVHGKHIDEAPGTEWFLTSPSEVEEIYKSIGESSCEGALDG